jgi:Fur family transcriptional regulator, zinc uptake regulator
MAQACEHEPSSPGLSGPALSAELATAEARCAAEHQRLTAPRRRVLQLLLQAGQPVKAYDLIAGFGQDGEPAKPPTVYRALDFLERQGFAHRIESLNAFVACRSGEVAHSAAFLICDCCGRSQEIEPVALDALGRTAEGAGYRLRAVTMEAHGLCEDCRR